MSNDQDRFEYDVALSFAGEDRSIVDKFVQLLHAKNITVFYDNDNLADLWGKNLIDHLAEIYGKKARFCLMFISQHYPLKKWTNLERTHAQARAFRDPKEYILPIRLDDTDVPGIAETIGYIDLRKHSPESAVSILEQKIAKSKGQPITPQAADRITDIRTNQSPFGSIPMPKPKKAFTQLEKDRFARGAFTFIKEYFNHALKQLETMDSDIQTDMVDVTNFHFASKIYVRGDMKAQCNIWLGDSFGPNSICYNEGVQRLATNSINESMAVEDNGDELCLRTGIFAMSGERKANQQQAAEHLWTRFITPLSYR